MQSSDVAVKKLTQVEERKGIKMFDYQSHVTKRTPKQILCTGLCVSETFLKYFTRREIDIFLATDVVMLHSLIS